MAASAAAALPARERRRALLCTAGDPLQSVIDTVCIGQFAGTGELAALAPALVIFAFAQYSFQVRLPASSWGEAGQQPAPQQPRTRAPNNARAFGAPRADPGQRWRLQALQIATITLVGDALRLEDREQAGTILATAIWVAALLGLATTGVLEVDALGPAAPQLMRLCRLLAPPSHPHPPPPPHTVHRPPARWCLLQAFPAQLITLTGADSSLVPLAAEYMRIRALAQPAVLVTMVCQAGGWGQAEGGGEPLLSIAAAAMSSNSEQATANLKAALSSTKQQSPVPAARLHSGRRLALPPRRASPSPPPCAFMCLLSVLPPRPRRSPARPM